MHQQIDNRDLQEETDAPGRTRTCDLRIRSSSATERLALARVVAAGCRRLCWSILTAGEQAGEHGSASLMGATEYCADMAAVAYRGRARSGAPRSPPRFRSGSRWWHSSHEAKKPSHTDSSTSPWPPEVRSAMPGQRPSPRSRGRRPTTESHGSRWSRGAKRRATSVAARGQSDPTGRALVPAGESEGG
jgi:hypothetical protein